MPTDGVHERSGGEYSPTARKHLCPLCGNMQSAQDEFGWPLNDWRTRRQFRDLHLLASRIDVNGPRSRTFRRRDTSTGAEPVDKLSLMSIAWAVFDAFRRPVETRSMSWTGVIEWSAAIERLLGEERNALGRRRASSDRLLQDLEGDPSARDWTSFLPLRREREEDWSDWLAQLFDESNTGLFAHTLLGVIERRQPESYVRPTVHREVLYEGYRADLVVEWADASYTHIEVKVGDPNLDKTLETAHRMEERFGRHLARRSDAVLLLPSQVDAWDRACVHTEAMRERVHCLTWLHVAVALRRALPRLAGESIRWRVWAHAFCGAIEQDLLGMRAGVEPHLWAGSLSFQNLQVAATLLGADGDE